MSFLCLLAIAYPASPQCANPNRVFSGGEKIVYTASYNWGPVWIDAGVVTFEVIEEDYMGKPSFHFKSNGKTFPSYDLLFKVRDYHDAWADRQTLQPFSFRRYVYEGGYSLLNTLNFDYNRGKIYANTKSNNNPQRADTLPIKTCGFDMLTAIYHTRTLDFASMKTDARHNVTVVVDDAWYEIEIRMIGRDVIETTNGNKYRCLKFAARMVQGTIFKGDEEVMVWVTDDENKIPVYVEAKIIVGTVKAWLKETKGLRNPVTSLIRD